MFESVYLIALLMCLVQCTDKCSAQSCTVVAVVWVIVCLYSAGRPVGAAIEYIRCRKKYINHNYLGLNICDLLLLVIDFSTKPPSSKSWQFFSWPSPKAGHELHTELDTRMRDGGPLAKNQPELFYSTSPVHEIETRSCWPFLQLVLYFYFLSYASTSCLVLLL